MCYCISVIIGASFFLVNPTGVSATHSCQIRPRTRPLCLIWNKIQLFFGVECMSHLCPTHDSSHHWNYFNLWITGSLLNLPFPLASWVEHPNRRPRCHDVWKMSTFPEKRGSAPKMQDPEFVGHERTSNIISNSGKLDHSSVFFITVLEHFARKGRNKFIWGTIVAPKRQSNGLVKTT